MRIRILIGCATITMIGSMYAFCGLFTGAGDFILGIAVAASGALGLYTVDELR